MAASGEQIIQTNEPHNNQGGSSSILEDVENIDDVDHQ